MKNIGNKVLLVLACLCMLAVITPGVFAIETTTSPIELLVEQTIATEDSHLYGESVTVSQTYDGTVTTKTDRVGIEQDLVQALFNADPSIHADILTAYYNAGKLGHVSSETHAVTMGDRLKVIFYNDGSIARSVIIDTPLPEDTIIPLSDWQMTGNTQVWTYIYNIFNQEVGHCMLEGYFQYNGIDTPNGYIMQTNVVVDLLSHYEKESFVLKYENMKMCLLGLDVHAYISAGIGDFAHRYFELRINCDKDGHITN
ncbi:hypothetical protein O0S10_07340 [Methanocorpusculum sp. MG]|uniref:Uncharacterized protein n=1 Tax=Methanocorpusculum petauri TaxID=3002863 RepID=A0ABT4IH14_9EURY|nr:hypothetical protein [Methanocorpusculum petauri]MCZ0861038.1 hypothetical protein [Methanocorpusculum petauri]